MSAFDRDDIPPDSGDPRDEQTPRTPDTPTEGEHTGITDEFEAVLAGGGGERDEDAEGPPSSGETVEREPVADDAVEAPGADDGAQGEPGAVEAGADEEVAPGAVEAGATGDHEIARQRLQQETVEADVLALGDAEEAAEQEAVARTEEPAAPRHDDDAELEADDGEDEPADHDEGADGDTADRPGDGPTDERAAIAIGAAATTVRSQPPPAVRPPGAEPDDAVGDEDDRAPKSRLWLRFLTASFVIVVSMATATAVTGLLYLTDLAKGLGGLDNVRNQLEQVEGGEPQNILILGSDQRPDDPGARSDTTMLIRLDPEQDAIALFSLPRDLRVNIPGLGVDRLNAAYSYGGPKLTLETVKQVTGLPIHHVVNVDFTGFYAAVNAIDCVYVDVDRRYYVPPGAGYAEINIEAGYQLLCGERALQYVRFRHADTDITRSARQQDFLREARQKISPTRLFRDREELIDIFKKYTTSDIEEAGAMFEVLKLFLSVADAPVKEIHFEGNVGPSYITFSQEQMQQAVDQFLGIEDTAGPRGGGPLGAEDSGGGGDGGGSGDGGGGGGEPEPALIDSAEFGRGLAEDLARQLDFPVFYPTKLTPGSQFGSDSRAYEIEDEDGKIHDIYKIVIGTDLLGEYYGVSGTTWEDPPILANPSETREIGNREFDLFYDGDRLRLVAWRTDKGAYWLNNSLLQSVDEAQMLEIAETMAEVTSK